MCSSDLVRLRISEDFQPLPDVAAVRPGQVELPYPTRPVEVIVEILSPDDQLTNITDKCRFYAQIGTKHIYFVDPCRRQLLTRGREDDMLVPADSLVSIPIASVWSELDRRIQANPAV